MWKDIGPSFEEKDVFAAPFKGKGALGNGGSTVGVVGRASKLTRLEGHGIPVECNSGREGEVLIQGRSSWTFFFGFLRKENMMSNLSGFVIVQRARRYVVYDSRRGSPGSLESVGAGRIIWAGDGYQRSKQDWIQLERDTSRDLSEKQRGKD